jgi:tRNA nucleotidyltransferase (CCA-adding enzyme)
MTFDALHDPNFPLWFVGGCVRDWKRADLLGKPRPKPKDLDMLAVNAKSKLDILDWLDSIEGTKVFTEDDHETFNVVRAIFPGIERPVDLCTKRVDIGGDGRRPERIEVPDNPEVDLWRRDFTVNAMAMTMDGELIDPTGGLDDLESNTLRFVGVPEERLREDALRAFRALRFTVVRGFNLDVQSGNAIARMTVEDFNKIPTQRIVDEVNACMFHDWAETMRLLTHTWMNDFNSLMSVMETRDMWFKPTMRQKP